MNGGVPELDVGVREGHLDLVVGGSPEAGVERADRAGGDSDVPSAGGRADSGQRFHEPDLHDQVGARGRRGQVGVVVVVGRAEVRRHRGFLRRSGRLNSSNGAEQGCGVLQFWAWSAQVEAQSSALRHSDDFGSNR